MFRQSIYGHSYIFTYIFSTSASETLAMAHAAFTLTWKCSSCMQLMTALAASATKLTSERWQGKSTYTPSALAADSLTNGSGSADKPSSIVIHITCLLVYKSFKMSTNQFMIIFLLSVHDYITIVENWRRFCHGNPIHSTCSFSYCNIYFQAISNESCIVVIVQLAIFI